jgi:hypothetical protein
MAISRTYSAVSLNKLHRRKDNFITLENQTDDLAEELDMLAQSSPSSEHHTTDWSFKNLMKINGE